MPLGSVPAIFVGVMATTPSSSLVQPSTVEPVGSSAANPDTPLSKKRSNVLRWVFVGCGILLLIIGGIAGGIYFARLHGKRDSLTHTADQAKVSATKPGRATETMSELPLEPFVVNLADAGGHSYARIGLTLHLATQDTTKKKEASDADAQNTELRDMVRDQIISVLNAEQAADLLAPGGKDRLKQAITSAIGAKDPSVRVVNIYFTEFLVQS